MKAYKFLLPGRVSPFAGIIWPLDGWVDSGGSIVECRIGIHACRTDDLAWWLRDELWQVELEGEIIQADLKVVAARGRLLTPIDAWNEGMRFDFAHACAARAEAHARAAQDAGLTGAWRLAEYARDASESAGKEPAAVTAYTAAHAAGERSDLPGDPFSAERLWQSRWLTEQLGLEGSGTSAEVGGSDT